MCLLQVMWNNKVGDLGADAFLKVLDTNLKISKLYLTGNKVSETRYARECFAQVCVDRSISSNKQMQRNKMCTTITN